jgi:predicted O-methyltransferase YrrM
VVEFGSSLGLSTIYLAAGLADSVSDGLLIATEVVGEKAQSAVEYLRQAELESLVEMRVGDACETLRTNVRAVDFVFLDGRNDLYLAVLQLLEPALADRALVVADLSDNDPALDGFLSHVRDRGNGYIASTISLDDGVEVCVRVCTDTEATATRGRARHGNSRQGDSAVAKSGPARATDAEC